MSMRRTSSHYTYTQSRTLGSFRTSTTEHRKQMKPMTPPRFSIIMCTYNRRNIVLTALASLRKQTMSNKDFEVIVVDNGSSDGTFNAIQTYLCADLPYRKVTDEPWRVRCLLESENGLAHARNTGIQAAEGEIIVFLDDDVIVDPRFLERLQIAYDETQADAIGGSVNIHWEAPRPYWLSDDLLWMLGYYIPFRTRTPLPTSLNFSNSCFSVKREVLHHLGMFSPFLTKRLNTPINVEVADICRRLRQDGYTLWYEPTAMVFHRAPRARLEKAFFVGRAYWQGRSEILAQYADIDHYQDAAGSSLWGTLRSIVPELREMVQIVFLHRPLLNMARKSTSEQLRAAMSQACSWGRVQQQFMLSNHAPVNIHMHHPAVLVVRADEHEAEPLIQGLTEQGIRCTSSIAKIPFSWLWRHRAHQEQAIGVIHVYRPGSFKLNYWQRQHFLFLLYLAQFLGLRIACTDGGGWWQSVRSIQFAARRAFEHSIMHCSNVIHTFSRHVEQIYHEAKIRHRSWYYAHPGLRGTLKTGFNREQARLLLGLEDKNQFTYLCFAEMHSERELIQLMEAFSEMRNALVYKKGMFDTNPQLLIVGTPCDKSQSQKLLKRAALNSSIHLFLEKRHEDIPIYFLATDALVMPHFEHKYAGDSSMAMLGYSYERVVIAPCVPRLQEFLPAYATILYNPTRRSTLVQALLAAPQQTYQHTEREALILDARTGWRHYARHVVDTYKPMLKSQVSL